MLRPIKDRIYVKPEPQADTTESGLILVEHRKPATMGTVIAVGPCAHPRKGDAEMLADQIGHCSRGRCECTCELCEAAELLRELVSTEPAVKVGDTVIFSWTAGNGITLDDTGEEYVMLRECDILAVVEYA